MGMDGPGQIARLAEISEPDAAVITNIGISHIEKLGSIENIMKAKMEIARDFDSENILVVNWDDEMLSALKEELLPYSLIKVGTNPECDYVISNVEDNGIEGISFTLTINSSDEDDQRNLNIELPIPGKHNAINCGLAIAGAQVMGVEPEYSVKGIQNMEMTGSRLRVLEVGSIKIIDDSYNAAPSSMKSAIDTLSNSKAERRIAVLGGINEIGKASEEEHRGIGRFALDKNLDLIITIGEMAKWISEEAKANKKVLHFDTKEDMYPEIETLFKSGDVILIKASRGYELDKLAEEIIKKEWN